MFELMREPIKKLLSGKLAKVAFSTPRCLKSHRVSGAADLNNDRSEEIFS
jgi:hypothetical protein